MTFKLVCFTCACGGEDGGDGDGDGDSDEGGEDGDGVIWLLNEEADKQCLYMNREQSLLLYHVFCLSGERPGGSITGGSWSA